MRGDNYDHQFDRDCSRCSVDDQITATPQPLPEEKTPMTPSRAFGLLLFILLANALILGGLLGAAVLAYRLVAGLAP